MVALKKIFKGKDNAKEELREGKAVKAGRITPSQYVAGEKMEGEKGSMKTAKGLKTGALAPSAYAKGQKLACGGMVGKKK